MIDDHFAALREAADRARGQAHIVEAWGAHLRSVLLSGGRLLVCGNGGSAAEAQHLSGELTGRFQGDRRPYAAIPLHADTSALTAIVNDYGEHEMFARAVRAHGRTGDVLIALSTSGRSQNLIAAVKTAQELDITAWAMTGPAPNTLAALCDDAITVDAPSVATIQEIHLSLVHALCAVIDQVPT